MNTKTLCTLNNILKNNSEFSSISKRSSLNNLAIPYHVFVHKHPYTSILKIDLPPIHYNNSDECIDDKLCSDFIKLIGEDTNISEKSKDTNKDTKSTSKKSNSRVKTRKTRKTKNKK